MTTLTLEQFNLNDVHFGVLSQLLLRTENVFVVGGAVRDVLLGKTPHDFDLATDLHPDVVLALFGKKGKLTGQRFPTVRVKHEGVELEVSTFRKEVNKGTGRENCELTFADNVHDDLARRDLTVNALAFNVLTGEVLDNHNGLDDLNNRVVRFVGEALERVAEDPVRVLRASRFRSKLNADFSTETFQALCSNEAKELFLNLVPKEQVKAELVKALESPAPFSAFLKDLDAFGLLVDVFPELVKGVNLDGGPHHAETVFQHNLATGDAFVVDDFSDPKDVLARLAAFLHDYGKPAAQVEDSGKFTGHAEVGAELLRKDLLRLRFSLDEVDFVCKLVGAHMRRPKTLKGVRRLVTEFGDDLKFLLKLFRADAAGNFNRKSFDVHSAEADEWERLVAQVQAEKDSFLKVNVNGFDVQTTFTLKPGHKVGELLKKAKEFVLEDPEVNTKEKLLELLASNF